jgi:hypothetical protein
MSCSGPVRKAYRLVFALLLEFVTWFTDVNARAVADRPAGRLQILASDSLAYSAAATLPKRRS